MKWEIVGSPVRKEAMGKLLRLECEGQEGTWTRRPRGFVGAQEER